MTIKISANKADLKVRKFGHGKGTLLAMSVAIIFIITLAVLLGKPLGRSQYVKGVRNYLCNYINESFGGKKQAKVSKNVSEKYEKVTKSLNENDFDVTCLTDSDCKYSIVQLHNNDGIEFKLYFDDYVIDNSSIKNKNFDNVSSFDKNVSGEVINPLQVYFYDTKSHKVSMTGDMTKYPRVRLYTLSENISWNKDKHNAFRSIASKKYDKPIIVFYN